MSEYEEGPSRGCLLGLAACCFVWSAVLVVVWWWLL